MTKCIKNGIINITVGNIPGQTVSFLIIQKGESLMKRRKSKNKKSVLVLLIMILVLISTTVCIYSYGSKNSKVEEPAETSTLYEVRTIYFLKMHIKGEEYNILNVAYNIKGNSNLKSYLISEKKDKIVWESEEYIQDLNNNNECNPDWDNESKLVFEAGNEKNYLKKESGKITITLTKELFDTIY